MLKKLTKHFCSPDAGGASGAADTANSNDDLFEVIDDSAAGSEQVIDGLDAANATDTEGNPINPNNVPKEQADDELASMDYKTLMKFIKNKFPDEHQADINGMFNKRFKSHKKTEEDLDALKPLVAATAARYGLDPKDVAAVIKAAVDDNSNYEKEAYEKGFGDPAAYRKHLAEQAELDQLRNEKRIREEAEQNARDRRQLLEGWERESAEFRKTVPDFDFKTEWQNNEEFRYFLTSGLPVKKAYFAAHAEEMASAEAEKAAKQAEQRVINEVRANRRRPSENGARTSPAVRVKKSVENMSLADIERIFDEAKKGNLISID